MISVNIVEYTIKPLVSQSVETAPSIFLEEGVRNYALRFRFDGSDFLKRDEVAQIMDREKT